MRRGLTIAVLVPGAALLLSAGACTHAKHDSLESDPTPQTAGRHHGERVGPPSPAHLRVDVYTLRSRPKEHMEFSVDRIQDQAANPTDLLRALDRFGTAELAYRFEQDIDLGIKTELTLGKQVPVVEEVTTTSDGIVTPTVRYLNIGCALGVSGTWATEHAANAADMLLDIKLSHMHVSSVTVSDGIALPTFVQRSGERAVRVTGRTPKLVSMVGPPGSNEQEVNGDFACVARVLVDRLPLPD